MNNLDIHDVESPINKWWLKDLPPVDILHDDIKWLACDKYQGWFCYFSEPERANDTWEDLSYLDFGYAIKMPELSGDEWKHSLIHVDELAEWQAENK